jgi:hypothetical protein
VLPTDPRTAITHAGVEWNKSRERERGWRVRGLRLLDFDNWLELINTTSLSVSFSLLGQTIWSYHSLRSPCKGWRGSLRSAYDQPWCGWYGRHGRTRGSAREIVCVEGGRRRTHTHTLSPSVSLVVCCRSEIHCPGVCGVWPASSRARS